MVAPAPGGRCGERWRFSLPEYIYVGSGYVTPPWDPHMGPKSRFLARLRPEKAFESKPKLVPVPHSTHSIGPALIRAVPQLFFQTSPSPTAAGRRP